MQSLGGWLSSLVYCKLDERDVYISVFKKTFVGDLHRPGISSLRSHGQFHFAKDTSIGKSSSLRETFEGAPRPRPGAKDSTASVAS